MAGDAIGVLDVGRDVLEIAAHDPRRSVGDDQVYRLEVRKIGDHRVRVGMLVEQQVELLPENFFQSKSAAIACVAAALSMKLAVAAEMPREEISCLVAHQFLLLASLPSASLLISIPGPSRWIRP